MFEDRKTWLQGIVPPMITPLSADQSLDVGGLERLIEHLLSGGVQGLFILGSTGEGPSLSYVLRRELILRTVEQVAGRVSVLVGITDSAWPESVSLAEYAADAGAQAVVASAPYYFRASQEELACYVEQLADAVSLPLLVYIIPQLTKIKFEIATIRRLLQRKNVVGVKDSSGDMHYFHKLSRLIVDRSGVSLFVGPEELLADGLRAGGHGGVCGGANLFPRLYVDLYEANLRGEEDMVRALHQDVMTVSNSIYNINRRPSSFVNAIKSSLSQLGICQDAVAPPFLGFSIHEKRELEHRLEALSTLRSTGIRSVFEHARLAKSMSHNGDGRPGLAPLSADGT